MSYSTIQKTEVKEPCSDAASLNTSSNKNGFAKWIVVDGKLVCQWLFD